MLLALYVSLRLPLQLSTPLWPSETRASTAAALQLTDIRHPEPCLRPRVHDSNPLTVSWNRCVTATYPYNSVRILSSPDTVQPEAANFRHRSYQYLVIARTKSTLKAGLTRGFRGLIPPRSSHLDSKSAKPNDTLKYRPYARQESK